MKPVVLIMSFVVLLFIGLGSRKNAENTEKKVSEKIIIVKSEPFVWQKITCPDTDAVETPSTSNGLENYISGKSMNYFLFAF